MPQSTPDTLPANFNNWDTGPPDTLPANFTQWDKPTLTRPQAESERQIQQITTPRLTVPPLAGASGLGLNIGAPPQKPAPIPITQPAQNVLAQQGTPLAPAPPQKPEPFELGTTQTRPFTPAEQQDPFGGWLGADFGEVPEQYHGQFEQAARDQALSGANPVGTAMGAGEDIYSGEKSKIKAGGREFWTGLGQLGQGDLVHGVPRLAGGTFKMADPAIALAYIANPVAAAGGLVGGTLGSEALGQGAEALHASPETEDWARLVGAVGGGFFGGVKSGSMELESNMVRSVTEDYIARGQTPEAAAKYAQTDVSNFMKSGDGQYIGMPGYRMPPLLSFGRKVTGGVLGGLRAVVPFTGERPEEQPTPRVGPQGQAGYVPPGPPTLPVLEEAQKNPSLFHTVAGALMPGTFATPEQLATEAFRPRNAKSNWRTEIASALPDMKRGAQSLGLDENNVTLPDALSSAETGQQSVWQEYKQNFLEPMGEKQQNVQSVADAIRGTITPRMREQNPGLAGEINRIADTYQGKTLNVEQLQQRVTELNNETRGIEAKYVTDKAAAKNAPENAYKFAERDTLRSLLDSAMDSYGPEAAALRRRYGALTSVRDVISRRLPVADRASRMPITRAMALTAAAAQMAAGIVSFNPHMLLSGAATLGAEAYIRHVTSPDVLTRAAFRKTTARPPWQILPQQGELPYPPIDLFGINQTPPPQRTGPFAMPPSSQPPQEQGQLPAGPEQMQLPGTEPRQLPAPRPEPVAPEMPPFRMRPSPLGPQRPALPPARLPERQISPTPGFEAPTAPSASAEQEALQRARAQGRGPRAEATPEINQAIEDLFTGRQKSISQAHAKAISNMLLGAEAPPETMDWNVVRPGKGLPNAISLNDTARQMVGASMGARFGGASVSPATLDSEVLPRLEMAAMTMDKTRAQRPDYFSPDASAKVRDLIRTIEENRGPEGVSFTRSEGTPEEQRYTLHEELFHTAVQRRPSPHAGGLYVPNMSDDPGFDSMRQRIYNETGRLTSPVQHAEGMADIMQGRAPELTPEQAGASAEEYWRKLANSGPNGLQAAVDAFKLENFFDDHQQQAGYTLDNATEATRNAGRNALARVLSRAYGEDLRGLARAVQGEPKPTNIPSAAGRAGEAGSAPDRGGEADLRSPAEVAAGAGGGPTAEVTSGEEPLFSPTRSPKQQQAYDKQAEAKRISARKPTSDKAPENPLTSDLRIDTDAIRKAGLTDKVANVVRNYPGVQGVIRDLGLGQDSESVLTAFQKHLMDNYLFLHDNYKPEFRDQAVKWYDGANDIETRQWPKLYGTTDMQNGGGMAAISPKLDWNKNIGIQQRVIEALKQQNEMRFTPKMKTKANEWMREDPTSAPLVRQLMGRKLGDLQDPLQKALWIHIYQEAEGDPHYTMYAPDGTKVGTARTQNGKGPEAQLGWTMDGNVAKAVSIFENPSRENIDAKLGDAHKIRQFYNNKIAPNSPAGDTVSDTHHVAAGLFRPLGMKAEEVGHNFSGPPTSVVHGVNGTYGLYADGNRAAAAQRDLLSRQMQSVVWDNARALFPASFKSKANNDTISNIWRDYDSGKITNPDDARQAIVDAAGGWKPPDWATYGRGESGSRSYPSRNVSAGPAAQSRNVPAPAVSGAEAGSQSTLGGRRVNAPAAVQAVTGGIPQIGRSRAGRGGAAVTASPIPPQLKRAMKK